MLLSVEKTGAYLGDEMTDIDIRPNDFWPNDVVSFCMAFQIAFEANPESLLPVKQV